MGRKQFSYPNLCIIKNFFILFIQYLFFWEKLVKITLAEFFLKMFSFIIIHPSLDVWTHEMGLGNGIPINCKRQWKNSYK